MRIAEKPSRRSRRPTKNLETPCPRARRVRVAMPRLVYPTLRIRRPPRVVIAVPSPPRPTPLQDRCSTQSTRCLLPILRMTIPLAQRSYLEVLLIIQRTLGTTMFTRIPPTPSQTLGLLLLTTHDRPTSRMLMGSTTIQ